MMTWLSRDQKVKLVYFCWCTKSIADTQRRFRAHFKTRHTPTRKRILRLCENFIRGLNSERDQTSQWSARIKTNPLTSVRRSGASFSATLQNQLEDRTKGRYQPHYSQANFAERLKTNPIQGNCSSAVDVIRPETTSCLLKLAEGQV